VFRLSDFGTQSGIVCPQLPYHHRLVGDQGGKPAQHDHPTRTIKPQNDLTSYVSSS
jgi:hypothetical protein